LDKQTGKTNMKSIAISMLAAHNAMWERNAEQLFDATYQWLTTTTYQGQESGSFDLE
jgi:hypothetical protein